MNTSKLQDIIARVIQSPSPDPGDLVFLLSLNEKDSEILFAAADRMRREIFGEGILVRALVEFSNHCSRRCFYCGLNKDRSDLKRYDMSMDEICMAAAQAAGMGLKTIVLQSGENDDLDPAWLVEVVAALKVRFDLAVTLSCGEKPRAVYELWKNAGADRYLLKIETSNPGLYRRLHPDMDFQNRMRCLDDLAGLGYQVGSGGLVGLPGQTREDLKDDILFFHSRDFDMLGIGPFIPHPETPLAASAQGDLFLTLKMLAVTRLVVPKAHMPATTAVGSLSEKTDDRLEALRAGANVLMPNFTPAEYRSLYEIYPHKRCLQEPSGACVSCMEGMANSLGRYVDYSRGDSLKSFHRNSS